MSHSVSSKSLENGHYSTPTRGSPSSVNMKKANEDLKRRLNKMRLELESERTRNKMVYKEKVEAVKAVRDQLEKEKDKAVEATSIKLLSEKHVELQKLREKMAQEKDSALRQVLQYKEEELRLLKLKFQQEKEDSVRVVQETTREQLANQLQGATSDLEKRLMKELKSLKVAKEKAEEQYEIKCQSEQEKIEDIRRLCVHHEAEKERILKAKKDEIKIVNDLQSVRDMLRRKDQEIEEREQLAKKIQIEKDLLEAELHRYKQMEKNDKLNYSLTSTPKRALHTSGDETYIDPTVCTIIGVVR
ncbi:uncharacterized protein LOC102800643 [Saccoglossus kowalevskii]|uniref:Janus kinase and microtubule-interacting protein 1-like n=1 Tax=Saccoglossus kowalevskii TaxID=10224 RepID=A0ABM0LVL2_SACKO|nr:PREDICTED: janus kinase and microtubule-interacting protein 1-like [Saccoglossus kowalevskii]